MNTVQRICKLFYFHFCIIAFQGPLGSKGDSGSRGLDGFPVSN